MSNDRVSAFVAAGGGGGGTSTGPSRPLEESGGGSQSSGGGGGGGGGSGGGGNSEINVLIVITQPGDVTPIRINNRLLPVKGSDTSTPSTALLFPGALTSLYVSSILGVWEFNRSLEDFISQNDFVVSSGDSVEYIDFNKFELISNKELNRSGLLFRDGVTYSAPNTYSFEDNFTMAFWYFSPRHVGFTRHISTRELEPKIAPIIALANSTKSSTTTTLSESSFVVTEIAYSKTQNAVRVYLTEDGSNISQIIESEPYDPGLHHILFTFMSEQGRFRIDIDGKPGIGYPAPVGNLNHAGYLRINDVVPGYLAHKTTQAGAYIFDLIFSKYEATNNESLKAVRYGYKYIVYEDLFDSRFAYFGMSYEQPATVSTTHIFIDGGNLFATRSNGEIVLGSRPIWDKEFGYTDANSLRTLNISKEDDVSDELKSNDRVAAWTPSGLQVQGVSVKI